MIVNLKDYMEQRDDPETQLRERSAERDSAIAAARGQLQGYPANVRDEFETLLTAASAAIVLTEDHGFWIDFNACYRVRQVVMELGQRLTTAGIIAASTDVFSLNMAEISAAAAASPAPDHTALVATRKQELKHFGELALIRH